MEPKDLLKIALTWLIAHAIYLLMVFCVMMGAAYQFVNTKGEEGLSVYARIFSQFVAVLAVSILSGSAIYYWKWNAFLVSFFSIFLGMGGDKILRLALKTYNESNSFPDFFGRLYEAFTAFWKAFNAAKNNTPTP
ncbi:hypothetical protein [Tellurirhabdus bombi]|uniref:hypothetical protein n=1 Tax=Tellurirhabdus bombi TaxID=2907205 RepID=UPI001F3B1C6E|nr:hypothetical protein [Tellurirhabdus bombi]